MKLYKDEKAEIRGEDCRGLTIVGLWFLRILPSFPRRTPIHGQAIGTYEFKEEMATLRKPHLLFPMTKIAAHWHPS